MKRLICILWSLLLIGLCGCNAAPTADNTIDIPDVAITIKEADLLADPPTLTVTWHNATDKTIQATSSFDILRRDGDGFESCFDSTSWEADASRTLRSFPVEPSSTTDVTYRVDSYILPINEELFFDALWYTDDDPTLYIQATLRLQVNESHDVSQIPVDGDEALPRTDISMTVDTISCGEFVTLEITWHNDGPYDATFGEPYDVKYLDGDRWISTMTDENMLWIMPAYLLAPGGTFQKTYTPDQYDAFDLSRPGRYRLISDCCVSLSEEATVTIPVAVEFILD